MPMWPDQPREYRRLATECLARARQSGDAKRRTSLVSMAQNWLDLAEHAEHEACAAPLQRHAAQMAIGDELRNRYGPPSGMPPQFLALLARLGEKVAANAGPRIA
jgi:hypothetical protein